MNVAGFATTFDFQLTSAAADGFAFVIQGAANTALGSSGSGLGYEGIGTSAAVKFDLFDNAGEGNNSTGLYTNGAPPTGGATNLTPSGIDLHSGHVFRVSVAYVGTHSVRDDPRPDDGCIGDPGVHGGLAGAGRWQHGVRRIHRRDRQPDGGAGHCELEILGMSRSPLVSSDVL